MVGAPTDMGAIPDLGTSPPGDAGCSATGRGDSDAPYLLLFGGLLMALRRRRG